MNLILTFLAFYFNLKITHQKDICISPISYMQPPICTEENIGKLGYKKTYEYANLLFGTMNNSITKKQADCIINGPFKMNKNIRECINQLTINNNTLPTKVARGLALNNDNVWVSACAENMPCIEFNKFVFNGTFTKLLDYCNAKEPFKILFNNTHFIKSSWYGVKYCQNLYPKKCLYKEKQTCSNKDYVYACPVSRWVYASNFMLFYILNPLFASRLPNCRII